MKRQVLIFLLCVIAVLISVIAAMVWFLYYDAPEEVAEAPEVSFPTMKADTDVVFPVQKKEDTSKDTLKVNSFPVVNCLTAKENLLRQNDDLSLELIDHNGHSLWKIPFPGKLCGSLVQVDFYNNRKVQFMVADGHRVHLIDRLGREVETFPRPIPEEIVFGPEEIMNHGARFFKLTTKSGALYFTLKDTKVLTQLPE